MTRSPLILPREVSNVEGHQFRAARGERHAEGDQRPVAQRNQAFAFDGPEQLGGHVRIGRRLAVGARPDRQTATKAGGAGVSMPRQARDLAIGAPPPSALKRQPVPAGQQPSRGGGASRLTWYFLTDALSCPARACLIVRRAAT